VTDLTERLLDHAAEGTGLDRDALRDAAPHPYTREAAVGIAECLDILGQLTDLTGMSGISA